MEIMTRLYRQECLVLAPRKYNLVAAEFRSNLHHRFLGSATVRWLARRALNEAKYLHFSDWPYPDLWSGNPHVTHDRLQPDCEITIEGEEDCSSRDVWDEIYDEFLARRQVSYLSCTNTFRTLLTHAKRVCGSRYMPD